MAAQTANGERAADFVAGLRSRGGRPFVVVSPGGPTDGGDYGPNTPGTTTGGLQEAINHFKPTGGTGQLVSPGEVRVVGTVTLTGQVDLSGIQSLAVSGCGGYHGSVVCVEQNSQVVFDLTNSRYLTFQGLTFHVPSGSSPTDLFLLARDSGGASCGDHVFDHCYFDSSAATGADVWFYNYGSEVNNFLACKFNTCNRQMVITGNNVDGVTSPFQTIGSGGQSMNQNSFFGCSFTQASGGTGVTTGQIELQAGKLHLFQGCYVGGVTSNYGFHLRYPASGSTPIDTLGVLNTRFEQRILTSDNPAAATNLINFSFDGIEVNSDNSSSVFACNQANLTVTGLRMRRLKFESSGNTLDFSNLTYSEYDSTGWTTNEPTLSVNTAYTGNFVRVYDPTKVVNNGTYHEFNRTVALKSINAATTLSGTTAGTITHLPTDYSTNDNKLFAFYLNGYENTTSTAQTVAFTTRFNHPPALTHDDSGGASVSSTTLTLPASMGSPKTGWIIVEGF